jgi:hypothetical protein
MKAPATLDRARIEAAGRLRRQRQIEAIDRLNSARIWFEFVDELVRVYPEIGADIDRRLGRFAALNPVVLRAAGGDGFAPLALRSIGGAR